LLGALLSALKLTIVGYQRVSKDIMGFKNSENLPDFSIGLMGQQPVKKIKR
jgi:hypothetical protein